MLTVNDSIKQAYNQYTTQRKSYIQVGNNSFFIQNLDVSADAYNEGNIIGNAIAKIAKFDIETAYIKGIDEFELFDGIWTGSQYEYISLGIFKLFNEEGTDDFFSSITAYDKLINFNREYDPSLTIYPTTLYGLLQNVCSQAGVKLENAFIPNGNQLITSNLFVENETLKMILNAICQISGNFGIISKDKLKLLLKGTETIDLSKYQLSNPEYKRTTWKINQVVLGMKDVEGEYVLRQDDEDITKNGVHKLVINDNPFVYTQELREKYIDNLFDQINGFGYVAFETKWEGLSYVELGDLLNLDGKESIVLRYNLKSPQGLNSTLSAPSIIDSVVEYVDNSNSITNRQKRTEIMVDKQNQLIQGLVNEVEENNEKVAELEITVDSVTTDINHKYNFLDTEEGTNQLELDGSLEYKPVSFNIQGHTEKVLYLFALNNVLDSLVIEGKSEQETRSGKNLYNVKDKSTVSAHATIDNDDWITISCDNTSGSSTVYTNYWTNNLNVEANTNYNIITEVKSVNVVAGNPTLHAASYNTAANGQFLTSVAYNFLALVNGDVKQKIATTKTTLENVVDGLRSFISFPAGSSGSITFRISVLEDTTITADTFEYEQYGASPSPDYPSEIKTIPSIRNLFDKNNINYIKGYITGEGAVWVDNNDNVNKTFYIKIKPNTTYTISKKAEKRFRVTTFSSIPAVTTQGNVSYNNNTSSRCTITTGNDDNYLFVYYYVSNDYTLTEQEILDSIMIEEGSIAHDYVPYGTWLKTKITGKNFLDVKGTSYSSNGITTIYENDYLKFSGTPTKVWANLTPRIYKEIPVGTYTFSITDIKNYGITLTCYFEDDTYYNFDMPLNSKNREIILTRKAVSYYVYIWNLTIGNTYEDNIKVQLEQGTTATDYEEYKEQEVLIDLSKPNLFDKENANILNVSINADKNIATSSNAKTLYIPCQPNTTYTVSKIVSNRFRLATTSDIPAPSIASINYIANDTASVSTITTSSNAKYLCVYYFLNGTDTLTEKEILDSIKIYEGYNDYYELSSIGDTKDLLEIKNGEVVLTKNIGKIVLNASESNWIAHTNTTNGVYTYYRDFTDIKVGTSRILSDYFTYVANCWNITTKAVGQFATNNISVYFNNDFSTLNEFKTWLNENPVTVYYELVEPKQITLPNTNIPLFDGVNHISLIEDVETTISATYKNNSNVKTTISGINNVTISDSIGRNLYPSDNLYPLGLTEGSCN